MKNLTAKILTATLYAVLLVNHPIFSFANFEAKDSIDSNWLELDGKNVYYAEDSKSLNIGDKKDESITVEAWLSFTKLPSNKAVILSKYKSYRLELKKKTITWEKPNRDEYIFSFGIAISPSLYIDIYFFYEPYPGELIHLVGAFNNRTKMMSLCINGEYYSLDIGNYSINNSDSPLVIGGQSLPHIPLDTYNLRIYELRISNVVRYEYRFFPSKSPFEKDDSTRVLYHFLEKFPPYNDFSENGNILKKWVDPASRPWDINKDGKVNMADINLVDKNFGKKVTNTTNPNPDVNGDGVVDILDLVIVCQHYGETY